MTALIKCSSVLLAQFVFTIVILFLFLNHGVSGLDLAVQPRNPSLSAGTISVANPSTSTSASRPRTGTSISRPSTSSHSVRRFYLGTPWHATHSATVSIYAVTSDFGTAPLAFPAQLPTTTFHVSTTTTTIWTSFATSHADYHTEVPKYAFAPTNQIPNQDGISASCH